MVVDIVSELSRPATSSDRDSTSVIWRVERAVSLLDGHRDLIAKLRMFLPHHYHVDVQSDAVVVKVMTAV